MGKLGLDSIRTTELNTITSVLDAYLVPIFTSANAKPNLVTVANLNAGGVLDSNNTWSGTNDFNGNVTIKTGNTLEVEDDGGLSINSTAITATGAEINKLDGVTASTAELNYVDVATAGILEASKALVVDANKHIDEINIASIKLGASGVSVALTPTATEFNRLDDSAEVETIDSGVAVSATKFNTNIDNTTSGAGAITLGACPATMVGKIKTIRMAVDNGDVTLALTNVQGGTAGTTATFDDVGEELILVGSAGGKWTVIKEFGVTLS